MSLKSNETSDITSTNSSNLAVASSTDAQTENPSFVEILNNDRSVHYTFNVLDNLSSSYSMFKSFFDMTNGSNNTDVMHDLMMTPGGIIAISFESIFLVGFSFLACHYAYELADQKTAFKDEKREAKENANLNGTAPEELAKKLKELTEKNKQAEQETTYLIKKYIAAAWPYFRDIIKALKNSYKGIRSTLQALSLFSGVEFKSLITPVGLLLGIFASGIRLWSRSIREKRKSLNSAYNAFLSEYKKLSELNKSQHATQLELIQSMTMKDFYIAYMLVFVGGFIDSLYLYVGVLSLTALSLPLLAVLSTMCVVYTIACVINRVYEEYEFQIQLESNQKSCELVLARKALETTYACLLVLSNKSVVDIEKIKLLKAEANQLVAEFERLQQIVQYQVTPTYFTAFLLGIKNGLYAYSAVASALFFASAIFILSSTAFPPLLLLTVVSLGLGLIMGYITHSLISHAMYLKKPVHVAPIDEQLIAIKNAINTEEPQEQQAFQESVEKAMILNSPPRSFLQERFEIIRCFFSGLGKGQKFVDFAGNFMQERNEQGHYQDTPTMLALGSVSALFFSAVLSLRALAKGFGNSLQSPQEALTAKTKPVQVNDELAEKQADLIANAHTTTALLASSPTSIKHHKSLYSFFNPEKKPMPDMDQSKASLNTMNIK